MEQKTLSLGERILLATRLAIEEHLLQDVRDQMQSEWQGVIGGADDACPEWDCVTEDALPFVRERACAVFGIAHLPEGKAA